MKRPPGFPLLILSCCLLFSSCEEKISGQLKENQPPETSIFVNSGEDSLNHTQSVQTMFWDGTDADGFVTGFFYSWEDTPSDSDWVWTVEYSMTFPLQISGADTIYRFSVKAVDDDGMEDPTPASQLIPIINSPPEISWTNISTIPDTTFTVAVFSWTSSDPDGDSTLSHFEYALDDTSDWIEVDGAFREVTLRAEDGLTEGDHAFFIRAVDVAGARSEVIRMPETPSAFWYVRTPPGRYLLIDDFGTSLGAPDTYYRAMMDEVLGELGEAYAYWNIRELFPASITQFVETVNLYDRVVWYSDFVDEADQTFIAAQIAIPEFRDNGGKIIYSLRFNINFGAQGDPLGFSPVDSLGTFYSSGIANGGIYYPDAAFAAEFPELPPVPELEVSTFIVGIFALVSKANSIPMYRYDDPNKPQEDPVFVMVGQNDNTGDYDFVFAGTPLHFLRGNENLNDLFRVILADLFGN